MTVTATKSTEILGFFFFFWLYWKFDSCLLLACSWERVTLQLSGVFTKLPDRKAELRDRQKLSPDDL